MGVQVDLLTRDKTCHEKEFIDFEFDGKHISEFVLVAVFDGDRHSFDTTPSFEDEVSEVNGVDGQYYWGTKFRTITKSFTLATDGISEMQVNAFKEHFKPGRYGKFIEDKLACRYGYARVANTPTFSVVPFKKIITINVNSQKYDIEVNEYKGTVSIQFIFDEPYFYATKSAFRLSEIIYSGGDVNRRSAIINNIPIDDDSWALSDLLFVGNSIFNEDQGLTNKTQIKFYNPSIVPTNNILKLQFKSRFTSTAPTATTPVYFNEIADNYTNPSIPYNMIRQKGMGSEIISEVKYTSPNVVNQINRAISTAYNYYKYNQNIGWTVLGLEEALRLEITHPNVIGWAAAILRIMKTSGSGFYNDTNDTFNESRKSINGTLLGAETIDVNWLGYFNVYMLCLLADQVKDGSESDNPEDYEDKTILETAWTPCTYLITMDSKAGMATIEYSYNYIAQNIEKSQLVEEKCGDIMCSPYLKLDGGDRIDDYMEIVSWHTLEFFKANSSSTIEQIDLKYTYTYL